MSRKLKRLALLKKLNDINEKINTAHIIVGAFGDTLPHVYDGVSEKAMERIIGVGTNAVRVENILDEACKEATQLFLDLNKFFHEH